ncbi:sensor histidine kinase [Mangrovihabitans endophyticus]|nr:histidine kinase [Mangrovihabitans endophyticus]
MDARHLARLKAWKKAAERPLLLDVVLALVLAYAVLKDAVADAATIGDVLVALVAFVAVLMRRLRPFVALGIATAATAGAVLQQVSNPGLIVALGVITYSIAAHAGRRPGWICAVTASSLVYLTGLIVAVDDWWRIETLGIFAWIFMAAAAGDAARSHRAYIAAIEERAVRAERTREEEARRRVMDERLRIARELHDVVAHHIAVISVQAGAATHVLERRPDQVGPVLGRIREASDTVLKEIQSVVGVLRDRDPGADPGVDGAGERTTPAPGLSGLPDLIARLEAAGFRVQHRRRGEPRDLPAVTDLAAYRIAQEALTNAHRYGDGVADLLVEYAPGGVVLDVTNAVPTPVTGDAGSGYGLLGMRERAASAGGTVTAGPDGAGRFRVHAVLPVAAAVAETAATEPTAADPSAADPAAARPAPASRPSWVRPCASPAPPAVAEGGAP